MSSPVLSGQVALVTGATRGIGRGIALQLAEAGATVYITGRTLEAGTAPVRGSLKETAEEISSRGGKCIPLQCDHTDDEAVDEVFKTIDKEQNGKLDILVNNAYMPVKNDVGTSFWEQDIGNWDTCNNVGLRNHFRCTTLAARLMVPRKQGLIVNISSVGGLRYLFHVPYGVGKAALDRMAQDCGLELRKENVTMVSLWPGAVQTERMVETVNKPEALKTEMGKLLKTAVDEGESVEFAGKAVVALAADKNKLHKTGRVHVIVDLAAEYGFSDINGRQPPNMRSLNYVLTHTGHPWLATWIPSFVKLPKWQFGLAGHKF